MAKQTLVDIATAQSEFLELIDRAHAGEEITIDSLGVSLSLFDLIRVIHINELDSGLPTRIESLTCSFIIYYINML